MANIFENVIKGIKDKDYSVVLMHDIKKANIDKVGKLAFSQLV